MNKETILAKLADFPYGMDGFWLVAGAALVLFGVRSETADIDMGCTTKAADRLEADGYPCEITGDGCRRFRIGGDLEIFENWLCGSVEIVDVAAGRPGDEAASGAGKGSPGHPADRRVPGAARGSPRSCGR